jgi:hypothetical protein
MGQVEHWMAHCAQQAICAHGKKTEFLFRSTQMIHMYLLGLSSQSFLSSIDDFSAYFFFGSTKCNVKLGSSQVILRSGSTWKFSL